MLSPLQVSTNVAAPCGIPRGLAGGDRIKIRRRKDCPHHLPSSGPNITSSRKPALILPVPHCLATVKGLHVPAPAGLCSKGQEGGLHP